eukprot:scaffold87573_cov70-Phaeocystis_antarctica.AAC.2
MNAEGGARAAARSHRRCICWRSKRASVCTLTSRGAWRLFAAHPAAAASGASVSLRAGVRQHAQSACIHDGQLVSLSLQLHRSARRASVPATTAEG